uniref:Uncharacterized protein n=1 Tax=Anguilla anguilla TaxID=7936 RepID=A0A0E9VXV1_ANGAN
MIDSASTEEEAEMHSAWTEEAFSESIVHSTDLTVKRDRLSVLSVESTLLSCVTLEFTGGCTQERSRTGVYSADSSSPTRAALIAITGFTRERSPLGARTVAGVFLSRAILESIRGSTVEGGRSDARLVGECLPQYRTLNCTSRGTIRPCLVSDEFLQ